MTRRHLFALVVAGVHLIGVLLTAWYVAQSSDGQAPLMWVYWAFIDFPFSLLYALLDNNVLLIHGAIGTAWWYALILLLSKAISAVTAAIRRRSAA
ncbi:MAG: hypothetical protein WDO68_11605 [Gammaproteobacteria bacterium]